MGGIGDSSEGARQAPDPFAAGPAPTATQAPKARFDVFLSHNSRDKDAVERIAVSLRESGINPWLDKWNIAPGARWQRAIAEGMDASSSCAVFVGEADLGDWTQQELDIAFDRAAKDLRFRVFPVLLPGIPEPFDATRLPRFLSTRNWVDLRGGIRDPEGMQQLINAVRGDPAHRGPRGAGPSWGMVAVGSGDRTARVWETATGRLVAELPHAGPVSGVAFSPNGRFLVASPGAAPTIWDLGSQRPLGQLFGHQGGVGPVDFSPDGSSIVTGGVDRSVRIWRCEVCAPIDEVLRLARARALRELTPAERAKFLHEGA